MKRFRLPCLALLFCLVLAACSEKGKEGKQPEPDRAFRAGAVLPLSGAAAQYGAWVQEGIEIALMHLRQDHPGKEFKVVYQDDQNAPDRSINALNKLIAVDRVPAVIGGVTSTCATPIAPIAQAKKTLLISPSASAPSLSEVGDHFFRVWSSDESAARQLAAQLVGRFKPKKVGLLYVNNDYGQGVLRVLSQEFTARGVKLAAAEGYPPGNTDFRAHMTRLKAARADVVLLVGYASELAYAVKRAADLKLKSRLVGQEGIESDLLFKVAGKAAEGLVYFVPLFDPDDPGSEVRHFVNDFRTKYGGQNPEIFAAHGYDAMRVLGAAMVRAGSNETEAIRKALAETKDFPGVTGRFSFDPRGDVEKKLMTKMVKDGRFVVVRD